MRRVLLDSVILIDHMNQRAEATDYLRREMGNCAVSPVTRAEVLVGVDHEVHERAAGMLDQFPCLPIDASVADLAARLRREYRWKLPDALQLAVARSYGCVFATRNTKDFSPNRHDDVVVPYRL